MAANNKKNDEDENEDQIKRSKDIISDEEIITLLSSYFSEIGLNFKRFPKLFQKQIIKGYRVELEHGTYMDKRLNVTNNHIDSTIKIAMAHIEEIPDYYDRLSILEKEGEAFWNRRDFKEQKIAHKEFMDTVINRIDALKKK